MIESNLQEVFNDLIAGEVKTIQFFDRNDYEARRVALLRKFRRYKDLLDDLGGANSFSDRFMRCKWNSAEGTGTFQILAQDQRTNNRAKTWQVQEL